MNVFFNLKTKGKTLLALFCCISLIIFGCIDYSITAEIRLAPFYIILIIAFSFYFGKVWGSLFAFAASIFSFIPYYMQYDSLSFVEIWNGLIVLTTNFLVVFISVLLRHKFYAEEIASEKDFLLKETHHRISNNLSNVIGMIKLKVMRDKNAGQYLMPIERRIYSMLNIHRQLYKGGVDTEICMKTYLKDLIQSIRETYDIVDSKIEIELNDSELNLRGDQSEIIGLLVNELLINSIKHAFPIDQKGKVIISLKKMKNNTAELIYTDNGIGFEMQMNKKSNDSMGIVLINNFVRKLDGHMNFNGTNGCEFRVVFPYSNKVLHLNLH